MNYSHTDEVIPFDTSLVANDLERWIADTYALWSVCTGGNWKLLGGYPRNDKTAAMMKKILVRDWDITNLENGMNEVNLLTAKEYHNNPSVDAWDYCRAMQLVGVFYAVGYIDRTQMLKYSCSIGKTIQSQYQSWNALCKSYLAGYEHWCRKNFSCVDAEERISGRRAKYEKFLTMKDGPYQIPWDLELTPVAFDEKTHIDRTTLKGSYFEQWLMQEELWIMAYRRKTRKTLFLIIEPLVIGILALFLAILGLVDGQRGSGLIGFAIIGAFVGLVIMLPVHLFVMHWLKKGRMSKAIKWTTKMLNMDNCEQEMLGMEMLTALQDNRWHLDYHDKNPHGQTTPARVLVSKDFFYQAGTGMCIILIRRSDVDFIKAGQERKSQNLSTRTVQSLLLHTICFYYRSSRERRIELDQSADNVMAFIDPAIRDKVFAMIDLQLR